VLSRGPYKMLFDVEAYVHKSMLFFATTTHVWIPHFPPSSHTRLLNVVSPRPPVLHYVPYHIVNDNCLCVSCVGPAALCMGRSCSLLWSAFRGPLCGSLLRPPLGPLSVLVACEIHSLSVVRRLCCGALAQQHRVSPLTHAISSQHTVCTMKNLSTSASHPGMSMIRSPILLMTTSCKSLSLYTILFHFKALLWESIILLLPPPPTKSTLSQYYCTTTGQYAHSSWTHLCHTLYNIGDGNIV